MELADETGLPCHQFRALIDEERIAASVIVRTSYDWRGTELVEQSEPTWPVSPGPFDSPQGPHPGDDLWLHEGVDCFLFGTARAPGGKPVEQFEVAMRVGDWQRRARVVGPRRWEKSWRKLLPTAPEPIAELSLDLRAAYGGSDDLDGLPVAYQDNPEGRGYAIDAQRALGKQLPLLEDPERPITAWDQPGPVVGFGFCPQGYSQRLEQGADFNHDGVLCELRASYFNQAFPEMVAPRARPGEAVVIEGMQAEGERRFRLPDAGLRVRLRFGEQEHVKALAIDQIGVEADEDRVFITWRYPFRYTLRPKELRSLSLFREGG